MDSPVDFSTLSHLKKYVGGIRRNHAPTMRHYVSDDGLGFFHQPRDRVEASRSSTATCVSALVQAGLWTDDSKLWPSTEKVAAKLLKTPWKSAGLNKDNPFSVAFIAEGVLDLERAKPNYPGVAHHINTIKKKAVPILLAQVHTGAVSISPYPPSAYLTQLAFRVLQRLDAVPANLAIKIHSWSRREINKEIALISAKSKIADPLNLAYALILATNSASDEQTSPRTSKYSLTPWTYFLQARAKTDFGRRAGHCFTILTSAMPTALSTNCSHSYYCAGRYVRISCPIYRRLRGRPCCLIGPATT